MFAVHPALALGQRYAEMTASGPGQVEFTVLRLDKDALGLPRVTFRYADNRDVTAYADQIETALAVGLIVPLTEPALAAAS